MQIKILKNRILREDISFAGYKEENRAEKLVFEIPEELSECSKKICFSTQNGNTEDVFEGNEYILTNAITKYKNVEIYLKFLKKLEDNKIEVLKTSILQLNFGESFESSEETSEEKVEIIDKLILDVKELINQVDTLNIDVERQEDGVKVTLTKKDGTKVETLVQDGEQGIQGEKGENAKINGVNTINIIAGDGIEIAQTGTELTIKNTKESDITDVQVNGESVVQNKIANIDISGKADKAEIPTKVSELENDSNYAKTNANNNFSTPQTINGTLTVNGDIVQNGESYETHAEEVYTKKDLIKTRDGAVSGLADGELTGIEAIKYDGTNNGRLAFDNKGVARVGDSGDEQAIMTRDEEENLSDGQALVWDAANLKAVGSSDFVKNTDYATNTKLGLIKGSVTNGIRATSNGVATIDKATQSDIDTKTNSYKPIVPSNLDYAVRSVLPLAATTVPSVLVANTEYYLGEATSLSFAFPTTGVLGQYCFVKFVSGATATALTITGENYVGDIPVPEANKTYEILATWNSSKWVCTYRAY